METKPKQSEPYDPTEQLILAEDAWIYGIWYGKEPKAGEECEGCYYLKNPVGNFEEGCSKNNNNCNDKCGDSLFIYQMGDVRTEVHGGRMYCEGKSDNR